MADSEDIRDLKNGERDLFARDFKEADLSGFFLADRDFGECQFQKANLSGADLSRSEINKSNMFQVEAVGIIAKSVAAQYVVFQMCNFSKSDFSDADLRYSHFNQANFSGSVLLGTDFSNCYFNEDMSDFTGAIVDRKTKFDNARISRAQAKQDAFKYYRVERGRLVRIDEFQPEKTTQNVELISSIRSARRSLEEALRAQIPSSIPAVGIGHNRPPSELALSSDEILDLQSALDSMEDGATDGNPEDKRITSLTDKLSSYAAKIGKWSVEKMDVFATEFAKGLGKEAATAKFWIALWLLVSGQLTTVVNIALSMMK